MSELELNDELFTGDNESEREEAATETAKCPSCGANLIYDPATRGLKCPYCGEGKELRHDRYSSEIDLADLFRRRSKEWNAETRSFRCKNCGAVTVISKTEIAKECAFCGTSNVVEEQEMSGLRPNAVLPFTVTKEQAGEALKKWAKKRAFAPNKLRKGISAEKISGNYMPCFTFDAKTSSRYQGRLGEYYYVTRTVNGKQVEERRVRYFNIRGTYEGNYDDVLVQASDRIPRSASQKLQPFDTNNSQTYSANYMFGFAATQYTKDGEQCWGEAKDIMKNAERAGILSRYTYDIVDYLDVETDFFNVTYKYVLLPVYVGNYLFKEKVYNFFVNGRNGKVAGQVPKSPLKVGALVLGILAAIVGIILLYLYYGG